MLKEEFDKWCNENYNKLRKDFIKRYPKCKDSIDTDFSDYYTHILNKHLVHLNDPFAFFHKFIFNRHYRYHSLHKNEKAGILVNNNSCTIKLTESFNSLDVIETEDHSIEDELSVYDFLLKANEIVIKASRKLALDDKKLFNLYYINDLSFRQIGANYGLSHTGIAKQVNQIKKSLINAVSCDLWNLIHDNMVDFSTNNVLNKTSK